MILYTGKDTRVFNMALKSLPNQGRRKASDTRIARFIDRTTYLMMFISVLTSAFICLSFYLRRGQKEIPVVFIRQFMDITQFQEILQVLAVASSLIPIHLNLITEVGTFIKSLAIHAETAKAEAIPKEETSEHRVKEDLETQTLEKQTPLERNRPPLFSMSLKPQFPYQVKDRLTPDVDLLAAAQNMGSSGRFPRAARSVTPKRRRQTGAELGFASVNQGSQGFTPKSENRTTGGQSVGISDTARALVDTESHERLPPHLKGDSKKPDAAKEASDPFNVCKSATAYVTNYAVVTELGCIDHLLLDKTDTLTENVLDIKGLATWRRSYQIDFGQMKIAKDDFKKNPEAHKTEDLRDHKGPNEDDFYSEKSQEHMVDLEAQIEQGMFEEDPEFREVTENIRLPFYMPVPIGYAEEQELREGPHSADDFSDESLKSGPGSRAGKLSTKVEQLLTSKAKGRLDLAKIEKLLFQTKKDNFEEGEEEEEISEVEEDQEALVDSVLNPRPFAGFFYDNHARAPEMENLVGIMALFLFCGMGEIKRSYTPSLVNAAVGKFLKTLGVTVSIPRMSKKNAEFGYAIKVTSEFGMLENFQVYGVNPKTETRPRTSIVLARKVGFHSYYFVVVRGEQAAMKDILEMGDSEQTLFRNLMVQYREQNLSRIIYAQKRISKEEVTAFVNRYSGIVKAKKYDADSIERVACMLESRLKFVGCIGVKAKIREEAKPMVDHFLEAGVKVSILSGDCYENTINVAKELGLSPPNPTDTSSYFNLSFDSSSRARTDFGLYIEQIYHGMKSNNFTTLNKALESRARTDEGMIQGQRNDRLVRNMVVGGKQLDIVFESHTLTSHFKVLLTFTGNILAHDLLPNHKAHLTRILRQRGDIVMAVGDGLNDLGMLNEANVGVQLSNGDVPLYFGDIVVNRLDILSRLVFFTGFNLQKNFDNILMFQATTWVKLVLANLWYYIVIGGSGGFYSHYHVTFLLSFFALESLYRACFVSEYSAQLLAKHPQVYQEKGVFHSKLLAVFYLCFLPVSFEVFLLFLLGTVGIAIENFSNGFPFEQDVFYLYFVGMIWLNTTAMNYFTTNASARYKLLAGLLSILLLVVLVVYHVYYHLPRAAQPVNFFASYGNLVFVTCSIAGVLVPSYITSIFMTVLKSRVLEPVRFFMRYYRDAVVKLLASDSQQSSRNDNERDKGEVIKKFLATESQRTTPDMIIDQVADIVKPHKDKPMDTIMQRLLLLNIHEFNVGFDQLTNKILDQREHTKFCSVNSEKHFRFTVRFILYLSVMYLIDIGIMLVFFGIDHWHNVDAIYRQSPVYMLGVFAAMLVVLGAKRRGMSVYRTVTFFMCLALAVEIALFVLDLLTPEFTSALYFHGLSISPRMISSAIPLNFPHSVVLILVFEGLSVFRVLFLESPILSAVTSEMFIAILVIDFVALAAAMISMKKKVVAGHSSTTRLSKSTSCQ